MSERRRGPSAGLMVVIAGVVVLGAAIAGWFLFNKSEPAEAEPTATKQPRATAPDTETPTPTDRGTPNQPAVASTEPTPTPYKESVIDGKLVRDHRKGTNRTAEAYIPPAPVTRPDGREITSTLTSNIAKNFKVVMRECTAAIPKEARGKKPRMEGKVTITIKDKVAKVVGSNVTLTDVTGDISAVKQCIETKSIGVASETDEADVENYDITTSFVF